MGDLSRRFLGWSQPILHSAADLLIDSRRVPESKEARRAIDLSTVLVALPGGRSGRRLLELLLERSEAIGLPLIPPKLVTVGRLPEELYRPSHPAPPSLVETLAWAAAIAEASAAGVDLSPLLPGKGEWSVDRGRDALAGTLRSLHGEIGAAAVDCSDVADRCRSNALFSDEERWRTLASIEERYRAILGLGGYRDRSEARREALATGAVRTDLEVVLIGAPDLSPLVRSFLEALSKSASVEILVGAPEALANHFDVMGCVVPEVWREEKGEVPDGSLRICGGPASQADAVAERLAELGGGVPAEEISIGVADPGVIPWIEERLEEVGVPVRYGGGSPIESSPTFRLLEAVANYLQRRDFEAFAALVRHPHLEGKLRKGVGTPSPAGVPVLLDRYQREHLQSRIDAGALPRGSGGRSQEIAASIHEVRDSLRELLEPIDQIRPLAEWRRVLAELLLAVYGTAPLRREVERERVLIEITKQIGNSLVDLESIPVGLGGSMSGDRVIKILLRELRGSTIPPASEEGAVELLGWLELPLDDAEVLILTGVNEPHLPESVSADPFLPHSLRQELGLLDNAGRWARDLFHLKTLLAIRPDTILIAGRRDSEGVALLPSRLLFAEDVEKIAGRVLSFLREAGEKGEVEEEGEEAGAKGQEVKGAGAVGEPKGEESVDPLPETRATARFLLPPDPVLIGFPPPERIRVTDFGRILQDPYRYALERLLGLGAEDDRLRELDAMGFGSLAHTVLERFGASAAPVMEGQKIRASLHEILDQEVRARFGSRALPALRVQVEQLRLRLGTFADRQAEWMKEGWRIAGVELEASGNEAELLVDGFPVRLRGKIDRIDLDERTGDWRLLDYKTGERGETPEKVHRKGRGPVKEWVDLQLPLYRYLAPALRRRDGTRLWPEGSAQRIDVGYLLLPRDPAEIRVEIAPWTDAEVEGALECAREAVRTLRAGVFSFDPGRTSIRLDDPLAPVIGGGVLLLDEADEDEEMQGEVSDG